MRYLTIGMALAAISAPAAAQDSVWQFYEPEGSTLQAAVLAADGSQLILKCDKPGKRKVYAVVAVPTQLAPAKGAAGYESRPVTLTFDNNAPVKDQWRFNDKFAVAMNEVNLRTMTKFAEKLAGASKLNVIMEPFELSPYLTTFDVTGATDALAKVYESCKDESPVS